jgi:hypothetical protein
MGPLVSWDIVVEGLNRRIELKEDLKMLEKISCNNKWHFTEALWRNSLIWENKVIILTDTLLNITYATKNIFEMNGYMSHEVIGNKPKMFQGEKTEEGELKKIRVAIKQQKTKLKIIKNYKKNCNIYK